MTKKDAFITLYTQREDEASLQIMNGFSFIDHYFPNAEHVFINELNPYGSLRKIDSLQYNRIFFSLAFSYQYRIIQKYVKDNWVIGGPVVDIFHRYNINPGCTVFNGTFEDYINVPLSNKFTDYWIGHMDKIDGAKKPVVYNCSLGCHCYWNKCLFCDFCSYHTKNFLRRPVATILAQLKDNTVQNKYITSCVRLCSDSTPAWQLKEILSSPVKQRIRLGFLLRADKSIADCIENNSNNTNNLFISVGPEAMSQEAIDILNKGILLEDLFRMTDAFLAKGGYVKWFIMDQHPFMTPTIADESIDNLNKAFKQFATYRPRFSIKITGYTVWPTKEIAQRFGEYEHIQRFMWEGYKTILTDDAIAQNMRIVKAIENSGIPLTYPQGLMKQYKEQSYKIKRGMV